LTSNLQASDPGALRVALNNRWNSGYVDCFEYMKKMLPLPAAVVEQRLSIFMIYANAIKLLDEEAFPVCSPGFNGGRLPKDPASMLSQPLLIDRNLSWRAWFRSAGLKLDRDIVGTSFTDTNALMEAAVAGQGIALGRRSVTRSDILAGKLVRLSEHSLRISYCHYAVYPIASESNSVLMAFRDWLVEEARRI
jgi:LysR family glycine cleavage system transcriptional activator